MKDKIIMSESELIIINGADVSKCDFIIKKYKRPKCAIYQNACGQYQCKDISNCYYKQLQRALRENQELRDNYVKLDLQRVDDINSLAKANKLLFQMSILAQQEYEDIDCYKTLKIDWFKHLQKIKTLREYKSNIMDRIKNFKKVAHDIDKEIEKRLKNGESEV